VKRKKAIEKDDPTVDSFLIPDLPDLDMSGHSEQGPLYTGGTKKTTED